MCKKAFFYFNLDPKIDRGIVSSNSEMAEWSLRDLATVIRRSGGGMWLLMMNIDCPSEIHMTSAILINDQSLLEKSLAQNNSIVFD